MDSNPYNGERETAEARAGSPENAVTPSLWRGGPVMVGDVILHSDIISEYFCCDIASCHGLCCEKGDAGAPVTLEEIAYIEEQLDEIWPRMTAGAQTEVDKNGVAYPDPEGEMVTSIVRGGDCVFRSRQGCLLPLRPVSCHLYPIRERKTGPYVALNYHRWDICHSATERGKREGVRLYQFLRAPLVRRFGKEWYDELELTAQEMFKQGLL